MQALLENAATQVVRLALHNLADCLAQLGIWNMGLTGGLGKPCRFEDALHLVVICAHAE